MMLRGHHLICLNFFSGEGYDRTFVENLIDIMKRIEKEDIKVCRGPDDVCRRCPHLKDNICQYDEEAEEEVRQMDETASGLLNLKEGSIIRWAEIRKRIPEVFSQWFAHYCYDCEWLWVCQKSSFFQKMLEIQKGGQG